MERPKAVIWVGDSKVNLKAFPEPVQKGVGYALWFAQIGSKHPQSSPNSCMFQKKSKRGTKTPPGDVALIKSRLQLAEAVYKVRREGT